MKLITIIQNERRHFARNSFKWVSFVLFVGAAVYGLQNGYALFLKQKAGIAAAQAANKRTVENTVTWFEEGRKGPEERSWIDITAPRWAIWYAPATAVKLPSRLMPFTVGQTEQFGYIKQVTLWSSTFDSDLAEEIANPERLTSGTLDFSFAILYLLPVLLIILLFNIGGLEKDREFSPLIKVNSASYRKWLFSRFLFYFVTVAIVLVLLTLPYAYLTGALENEAGTFSKLLMYILLYTLFWFMLFFLISLMERGSANQALMMIALWLLLCIVIPGGIHQLSSLKYPTSYMTDFIDASRDETYDIWGLPDDSVRNSLLVLYPDLAQTKHGRDSIADGGIMSYSSSGLVNMLMKKTAMAIEKNNKAKNQLIRSTYWINPVSFFQNEMNSLAANDYYAYKQFREQIQSLIDKKISIILYDGWNKEKITKERYLEYIESLSQSIQNNCCPH